MKEEYDPCVICFQSFEETKTPYDGPSNSDTYGNCPCKHFFCCECWRELYNKKEYKCPLCRFDCTEWMLTHYYESDYEDSDEDE